LQSQKPSANTFHDNLGTKYFVGRDHLETIFFMALKHKMTGRDQLRNKYLETNFEWVWNIEKEIHCEVCY
jgi:hypothetical protein